MTAYTYDTSTDGRWSSSASAWLSYNPAMGDDEIIDDDGCTIELDDVLYNNQTVA